MLENEVGVSVEQQVCLRVVSFRFVDLRLDVLVWKLNTKIHDAPPSA